MKITLYLSCLVSYVLGGAVNKNDYKDQFCTDPRTMAKHRAYSEWADAYSCTRHRCQPGGRNLAIYTVGCKRVEAPESAIECEEVVEDTNMQFPFCCTRLRCLVLVRGEVWTRVLGQPWETLPAAPWSHMYKMKKPPPMDNASLPKTGRRQDLGLGESSHDELGPIYELNDQEDKASTTENKEVVPKAPTPDIVIALQTNDKLEGYKKPEAVRREWSQRASPGQEMFEEDHLQKERDGHHEVETDRVKEKPEVDLEEATEKPLEISEERTYADVTSPKVLFKSQHQQMSWTEIPQSQWNHEMGDLETKDTGYHPEVSEEKKEEKPSNLQALVDAIGTRMRDIEDVVQRMSAKVQQVKPDDTKISKDPELYPQNTKPKRPNTDPETYNRFSHRGTKYLHTYVDSTTEVPLYIGDKANGYFSDASNNILRRAMPREPRPTYMAPVDTYHRAHVPDVSAESEKKKKLHKKRKSKGRVHKKHRSKDDKRKRLNRVPTSDKENNVDSEDISGPS